MTLPFTLKRVAVSGTMPVIRICGSSGSGMGSNSERFIFSLSARRACSRSVCAQGERKGSLLTSSADATGGVFRDILQQTFFFRFPLSLCTAFISCTSRFTKVSWEAKSERMILTLLSP